MLRSYASTFELLAFETPIPPLLASKVYAPLVLRRRGASRSHSLAARSRASNANNNVGGSRRVTSTNGVLPPRQHLTSRSVQISNCRSEIAAAEKRLLHDGRPSKQQVTAQFPVETHEQYESVRGPSPWTTHRLEPWEVQRNQEPYLHRPPSTLDDETPDDERRLDLLDQPAGPSPRDITGSSQPGLSRGLPNDSGDRDLQDRSHQQHTRAFIKRSYALPKLLRPEHIKQLAVGLPEEVIGKMATRHGSHFDVRPRFVSLQVSSDSSVGKARFEFSRDWHEVVSELAAKYDARIRTPPRHDKVPLIPQVKSWVSSYEQHAASLLGAAAYWEKQPLRKRVKRWPNLMLWYLQTTPQQALFFLRSTLPLYAPPLQYLADALDLVTCQLMHNRGPHLIARQHSEIWQVLEIVLDRYESLPPFSQRFLRSIFRIIHKDEVLPAFEDFLKRGVEIHFNTLLQITQILAESGRSEQALRVFTRAIAAGADVDGLNVSKVAAKILSGSRHPDAKYDEISDSLTSLFALNIRLTLPMYNSMIQRAATLGDTATAWRIYDMICANGVVPDMRTFTILLRMCRATNDKRGYQSLYFSLNPERQTQLDPYIITELLNCRYHFNERTNFDHVLRFYERHCDLQPLRDLSIVPQDYVSRFADWYPQPRPVPSTATLTVIIRAYIRSSKQDGDVAKLYQCFRQQVEAGNPVIVPLAATDHIYNAIMKGVDRLASFLRPRSRQPLKRAWNAPPSEDAVFRPIHWTEIFRTMYNSIPRHMLDPTTKRPYPRLRPTRQSWNIILNAQARAGDVDTTGRILSLMKREGMVPDIVTWNSLLSAAARKQDLAAVVKTLEIIEKEGLSVNDETARALSHIVDQQGLLAMLKDDTGIREVDTRIVVEHKSEMTDAVMPGPPEESRNGG